MNEKRGSLRKGLVLVAFGVCLYSLLQNLNVVMGAWKNLWTIISPIVLGLCMAFVLNVAMVGCERLIKKLFKSLKWKAGNKAIRGISLLLTLLLAIGFIVLLLMVIIPKVSEAVGLLISSLPQSSDEISAILGNLLSSLGIESQSITNLQGSIQQLTSQLLELLKSEGTVIAGVAIDVTSSLLGTVTDVVFALIIAIYVLLDKERIGRFCFAVIRRFLPEKYSNRIAELAKLSFSTFTAFVCGQFTEAVILGALCFVGMLLLRLPHALVVSLLIGVTALIPIIGAWIGGFIAAFLVLLESPFKALLMIVFILVLQQLEGNLIYPRVVGSSIGLPGVLVLSAVIIGQGLLGIVGILIAVPVTAILFTVLKEAVYGKKTGTA